MAVLPPPLVPPDVDVRDLDGFMLNVERLMASELWALSTGVEFKAAVGLWCRSWKQLPAGSLPNDERILAAFSGAGRRWRQVRDMALRGFVLCSDGRLYHQVLCADVMRAAAKKAARCEQTRAATEARYRQRGGNVTSNVTSNVTESHRQGHRQESEEETPSSVPPPSTSKPKKPMKALPDGWAPKPRHHALAADHERDERWVFEFAEQFRDQCQAKGYLYADHDAAFSAWMRKELANGRGQPNGKYETNGERRAREGRAATMRAVLAAEARDAARDRGDA